MTAITASPTRSAAVPLLVLVVAGCILAAVGNGIRTSFGLFTIPLTADLGVSREAWGMAMAVQNLAWGFAQPIAGGFADRYGTGRTVAAGLMLYAFGLWGMTISPDGGWLTLSAGVVTGVGIAISSFTVIMAAFARNVPQAQRGLYFGIATAASSFGQFVFAPIGQGFIAAFGWQTALLWLAAMLVCVVPLTAALRGRAADGAASAAEIVLPMREALRRAFEHPSYRLLVAGFFVCGFHIAFINVHLPAYLVQCGLSPDVGSWSIATIGLFNIVGSFGSGYLSGRVPKQLLLASIYLSRSLAIAIFLLVPVTETSAFIFAMAVGVLWLSTVPPTAGLVSHFFGTRYMGMLYGIVFLSHQFGSFAGVWLGGYVYDHTGSYALVWYMGILLGLASAAVHLPIREGMASGFRLRPA